MPAAPSPRPLLTPGRLAVGMQLPVQSQSTIYAQPWEATAGVDELGAIVDAADACGFDYLAVCDHIAVPDDLVATMSAVWFDTVATLGWIAGRTTNVHLLSHVYVAAYRHPAMTTKAWSTLDVLSGGRAILGVGAGHVEAEFELLGVDHGQRGARTDAALEAIRAGLATGRMDGYAIEPRPPRSEGPPVWIGGSSGAALRRTAEYGDGWLPQGTPYDEVPEAIATIAAHQERLHGDRWPVEIGMLSAPLYVGTPDFEVPAGTFSGPPERLARGLARLASFGGTQLQVSFVARSAGEYAEQVERFGLEALPAVHEASAEVMRMG